MDRKLQLTRMEANKLYEMNVMAQNYSVEVEGVFPQEDIEWFNHNFPLSEIEYEQQDENTGYAMYLPTPPLDDIFREGFDMQELIYFFLDGTLKVTTSEHVTVEKTDETRYMIYFTSRKRWDKYAKLLSDWVVTYTVDIIDSTFSFVSSTSTIVTKPLVVKHGSFAEVLKAIRTNITENEKLTKVSN